MPDAVLAGDHVIADLPLSISGTRMPVMLAPDGFEPWLSGEDPIVDPSLDAEVTVTPVSPKMNSPRYNEPDCIQALVA